MGNARGRVIGAALTIIAATLGAPAVAQAATQYNCNIDQIHMDFEAGLEGSAHGVCSFVGDSVGTRQTTFSLSGDLQSSSGEKDFPIWGTITINDGAHPAFTQAFNGTVEDFTTDAGVEFRTSGTYGCDDHLFFGCANPYFAYDGSGSATTPGTPVYVPPHNAGGGEADGTVSFSGGIPPATVACAPASFTLSGSSQAFAINTVLSGYAGPVTLAGHGGSPCESTTSGGGPLVLTTVKGEGPTGGTVSCADPATGTTLSGTYTRVGADVTAILGGTCIVNGFAAEVTFVFRGTFVPTNSGGGVTAPITTASFSGAFAVAPA